MSRRKDASPADPAAEIAVLTVERERLANEHLFREVAVANLEQTVAQARDELDRICPPMVFVDSGGARFMTNPDLAPLFLLASDSWRQQQLERIAGPPRPDTPSVDWSTLTMAERDARVAEIDARLAVLGIEVRKQQARERIAAEQAELAALEQGLPVPVAATETAVGDEDDAGAKTPA